MNGSATFTKDETSVLDDGERNSEKEQLEQFLERYDFEMTNLMTNLAVLRVLIERQTEVSKYFEYAPSFMAVSWYNAWFTSVVLLCSMLKKKSKGSLYGLLDFIQEKSEQIFIKEWDEAENPLEGNFAEHKIGRINQSPEAPCDVIEQCRATLESKEEEVKTIFLVRDKVYAHFDIISINGEQRTVLLDQINFGLIESLAKLVSEIINRIHALYEQKFVLHEPIQADDILKFYQPLCFYEEHIEQAIDEEIEKSMQSMNGR